MTNPLAELEAWWEAAAPDDGSAYTRLIALETQGEIYRLDFETVDDANEWALWRLDIRDIKEIVWRNAGGEPKWSDDHPLLFPYDADGAILSFAKPLEDPLRAWGALERAHSALVGDWFPLGRYFNTGLLHQGFGMFADGPEWLLSVYAEALRSVGEEFGYAPHDRSWYAKEPKPSVLTWDKSFFVAASFRLERLPDV